MSDKCGQCIWYKADEHIAFFGSCRLDKVSVPEAYSCNKINKTERAKEEDCTQEMESMMNRLEKMIRANAANKNN